MRIKSVFSHSFEKYGKVLTGYDVTDLLKKLDETTKKPDNAVIYEPGDAGLEALPIAKEFSDNAYGGMPIQVGYCNGNNTKLNCLEWHRGSELNIPSNDIVLLLASLQSVKNGKLNTNAVEAFYVPKGTVVQVYETTLHYAPCTAVKNGEVSKEGFRVIIVVNNIFGDFTIVLVRVLLSVILLIAVLSLFHWRYLFIVIFKRSIFNRNVVNVGYFLH